VWPIGLALPTFLGALYSPCRNIVAVTSLFRKLVRYSGFYEFDSCTLCYENIPLKHKFDAHWKGSIATKTLRSIVCRHGLALSLRFELQGMADAETRHNFFLTQRRTPFDLVNRGSSQYIYRKKWWSTFPIGMYSHHKNAWFHFLTPHSNKNLTFSLHGVRERNAIKGSVWPLSQACADFFAKHTCSFAHFFSYRSCKPLKIQPISKKEKISHTFTQFKHLSLLELEFFLTHCDLL